MDLHPSHSVTAEQPYKLEHISSGKPYIHIPTSSPAPTYLTENYPSDTTTCQTTLSLPEVSQHLISVLYPFTLADAEWWIDLQLTGKSNLPLQVLRAGSPDESGQFIGSVSLMPADSEAFLSAKNKIAMKKRPDGNELELGYYLHPDWRGKGIIRNAVRALLRWAQEEHGANNVVVRVMDENLASRGVIESLAEFVREEENDTWVEWPEVKGGGRRRLLIWRWTG